MAHPMHRACSLFTPQSLFCADVLMRLRPSRFSIHRCRLLCTFFLSSTVLLVLCTRCVLCVLLTTTFSLATVYESYRIQAFGDATMNLV